ncbi:MAG TPA: LPS export ABC transporter periplasmic protein LptC [bacterium]|nr:LPS export ABC transporter periplasmic protein LptC [Dictyoglomota bacterium]HHV80873.1 LPS export ABC transporter periplasmic protein LptC [bacterium]HOP55329.1 LPS export ABC transporter periplasmic protein LptC [bacterium]
MRRLFIFTLCLILIAPTFIYAQKQEASTQGGKLYGDKFIYDMKTKLLKVEGNVRVELKDGPKISGNKLEFNQDKQLMVMPGVINLEMEGVKITGTDMDADLNNNRILLKKDVKILTLDEQGKTSATINCSKLDYNTNTKEAKVEQVSLVQDGTNATANSGVFLLDKNEFRLTGNVVILREDLTLKSSEAVLNTKSQVLEAVGSVEAEFQVKQQ